MAAERFPVESSHVLMFARAIGDENPIYADPEVGAKSTFGACLAPPTFVQASAQFDPTYPLRPRPGVTWFGSGATPSVAMTEAAERAKEAEATGEAAPSSGGGGRGSGLHAEQHFTYHRPLLVGEVLTVSTRAGETWEKQGRKGGLLRFSESITEYRGADGSLVVTARAVGVLTAQPVKEA